jgi:hypothetical protein
LEQQSAQRARPLAAALSQAAVTQLAALQQIPGVPQLAAAHVSTVLLAN